MYRLIVYCQGHEKSESSSWVIVVSHGRVTERVVSHALQHLTVYIKNKDWCQQGRESRWHDKSKSSLWVITVSHQQWVSHGYDMPQVPLQVHVHQYAPGEKTRINISTDTTSQRQILLRRLRRSLQEESLKVRFKNLNLTRRIYIGYSRRDARMSTKSRSLKVHADVGTCR